MQENTEKNNQRINEKSEIGSTSAFKPSISIRRKQTRRLTVQVDEEKADSFDEYVRFVSVCFGYEVSPGEVLNEILKAHFARDSGFKGWRNKSQKNDSQTV